MTDHDNTAVEVQILARAHNVLDGLGDDTLFSSYDEFRLHASAFFVAVLQLLLKKMFCNVNRSPATFEDHCVNARVFLDAVHDHLQIRLPGVTPESICRGDHAAILKCIDVVESLRAGSLTPRIQMQPAEQTLTGPDALRTWNGVMVDLKLPLLSNWKELQENASSVITLIVEAILHKRLKKVVRRPLLRRDYLINTRLSLKALSQFLRVEIDSKLAERIIAGDSSALIRVSHWITSALEAGNNLEPDSAAKTSGAENQDANIKTKLKAVSVPAKRLLKDPDCFTIDKRQGMLLKQLSAMNVKTEAEKHILNNRLLKMAARDQRRNQIWKHKVDNGLIRDEVALKKIRDETLQYQIGNMFKRALKLERNYQRVQYAAFKDRRKQLEQQWMNKKISIERFFGDKYEMLLIEIERERARRKAYETQARITFRKMEKQLKTEREMKLQSLKEKLIETDRNMNYLQPEEILNRLFNIPVS